MSRNFFKTSTGPQRGSTGEFVLRLLYSARPACSEAGLAEYGAQDHMVSVQIFGQTLRAAVDESELEVSINGPTTVKQLIEADQARLGPLLQYIKSREALITINKKIGSEDSIVKDGDAVKLSFQSRTSYEGNRDIPT